MQDARRMCCGQTLGQLKAEIDDLRLEQNARSHSCVQRHAGPQLTDQIILAFERIEIVDGLNGWVIQAGEDPGLVAKPLSRCFVVQRARSQYLEGKVALQLFVVGAINDPHTTSTDLL